MNINLGSRYEEIIDWFINRGYGSSRVEIIRQALAEYQREVSEEETRLVRKATEHEMEQIRSGKKKTFSFEEVMKEAGV